jgi:hypothetical protein
MLAVPVFLPSPGTLPQELRLLVHDEEEAVMPSRSRLIGPEVSERVAWNIRVQREALQWNRPQLAGKMSGQDHPMSPQLISLIEMGVREGTTIRTRLITVDELTAFAQALGLELSPDLPPEVLRAAQLLRL